MGRAAHLPEHAGGHTSPRQGVVGREPWLCALENRIDGRGLRCRMPPRMSSESEQREAPKSGESLTISSGQHALRVGPASTISGVIPAPRWASAWWLVFLGLAVAEVVALFVRISHVPPEDEWA